MQGQSPYLINFGLNYANDDNGWQTSLYYNVQGKTLQVVGQVTFRMPIRFLSTAWILL